MYHCSLAKNLPTIIIPAVTGLNLSNNPDEHQKDNARTTILDRWVFLKQHCSNSILYKQMKKLLDCSQHICDIRYFLLSYDDDGLHRSRWQFWFKQWFQSLPFQLLCFLYVFHNIFDYWKIIIIFWLIRYLQVLETPQWLLSHNRKDDASKSNPMMSGSTQWCSNWIWTLATL